MNIRRCVLVLLVFAAVATVAAASCIVRQRNAVAVVAPAVVAPVAVAVPAYGASYDDQAAQRNQISDLQKRLAAVEARLAAVEGTQRPAPGPLPPAPRPNAAAPAEAAKGAIPAVYSRSCQQCHSEGRAKGSLALVSADGSRLLSLSCEQRLEILRRTNLKADDASVMPPKKSGHPAVSDTEAAELMELLTAKN